MLEAAKGPDVGVGPAFRDQPAESLAWRECLHLGEHEFAGVHSPGLRNKTQRAAEAIRSSSRGAPKMYFFFFRSNGCEFSN